MKDAAGRVEPAAKDFTSKTVRPAGDYVADNAVPLTKEYGERPSSSLLPMIIPDGVKTI